MVELSSRISFFRAKGSDSALQMATHRHPRPISTSEVRKRTFWRYERSEAMRDATADLDKVTIESANVYLDFPYAVIRMDRRADDSEPMGRFSLKSV